MKDDAAISSLVNPLYPPIMGDVKREIGDTPKTTFLPYTEMSWKDTPVF